MKIRQGFVSNSSSSSFIIALPEGVDSVTKMQEQLFVPDQTAYYGPWGEGWYCVAQVAKSVLAQTRTPLEFDEALDVLCSGYIERIYRELERDFPDRHDVEMSMDERREIWRQRDERERQLARELLRDFINRPDVAGKQLFCCAFSDDTQYGSDLEHGDLFNRVPHIHVSNH